MQAGRSLSAYASRATAAARSARSAIFGGLYLYRKYFQKEDDFDEDFDDDDLFEDLDEEEEEEEEVKAFDSEEEIFEEDPPTKTLTPDTSDKASVTEE